MPQPLDIEIDLPEYDFGKPKAAAPVPAAAPASVATAPAPAPAPRKAAPRKPVAPAAPVAPVAVVKPAPVAPQAKPVTIDVDAIKSGAPSVPKFDLNAPAEMPAGLVPPVAFLPAPTVPSTEAGAGAAAKLPDVSGKDELSGKKFADYNQSVELWRTRQAQLARDYARAGKKVDPEAVKRQAAVDVYGRVVNPEEAVQALRNASTKAAGGVPGLLSTLSQYAPDVSIDLKGAAMGAVGGALGLPGMAGLGVDIKIPQVTQEAISKAVGVSPEKALRDIEEKEAYVKSVSGVGEDPLVRKARADAERFEGVGKRVAPVKLVNQFINRYTSYLLVQNGKDALKNTDPLGYEKARKEADLDAREVALKLRTSGDPIFTAGYGVVTTDEVKKTIREKGIVAGVMKAGSVLLPQQVVSRSGETVRTESIPSVVMRDLFLGSALLASATSEKLPGSYTVDPLAAIQRGESMMTRALDNDVVRKKLASTESLDRATGIMLIAAATVSDIYMPGGEILAGPALVKSAQVAGRAADATHELVTGMRLADAAGEDVAKAAMLSLRRLKAGPEINAISRSPADLVNNIAARNAQESMSATEIRLALKYRSPGLSYIFETGVAARLEASLEGRALLNAVDDLGVVRDVRVNTLEKVQDGEAVAGILRQRTSELETDMVELKAKLAGATDQAMVEARAGNLGEARKLAAEAREIQRNITRTQERIDNAKAAVESDIPALIKKAGDDEIESLVRRAEIGDEMSVSTVGAGKLEAPAKEKKPSDAGKPLPATRKDLAQELAGKSGKNASLTDTARYATILKEITSRDVTAAAAVEKLRAAGVDHPVDILKGLLKLSDEKPAVSVAALEQSLRSTDVDLAAARADLEDARRAFAEPAPAPVARRIVEEVPRIEPEREMTLPEPEGVERELTAKTVTLPAAKPERELTPTDVIARMRGAEPDLTVTQRAVRGEIIEPTETERTIVELTRPELTRPEITRLERTLAGKSGFEATAPEITRAEITRPDITRAERTTAERSGFEATVPEVTRPEITAIRNALGATETTIPSALLARPSARGVVPFQPEMGLVEEGTIASVFHTGDAPVRQLDGVQRAMREKITDPDILKQVEMRYGKDRSQPFAYGGEPFQRPDRLTEPRQSVNLQGVRDPDYLFKLSRQRAYGNVYTYLSGSDPKGLDNLKQAIEVARAKGEPADLAFVEEAQRYIDTYAKNIDQGTREFAERVGLPHVASRKPFGKWEKQDADALYAALDAKAATTPSAPRARSENAYLRWTAARSAPDGVAPEVIRYDDLVSFSNPRAVKEAGPLNQRVVMPDNSISEKAIVGDWAHGKVVGTTTREGKLVVLVQPVEYTGAGNRYTVTADRPPVVVPVDGLEFRERGRVQELWYGPGKRSKTAPYGFVFGREEKSPRPMMASEWNALVEAEKKSGMNSVEYPRRGNELLYTDMAPPKRPTSTDFDTLDIQDELIKRGVPIPKYEGAGALTGVEQRAFDVTTELPRGQKSVTRMEQAVTDAEAALKKIEDQRAPIEAALTTRTKESATAEAVRKALDESLVGDDLTLDLADIDTTEGFAKAVEIESRPEVSLKRELREVNKYLGDSLRQASTGLASKFENAFINSYEYWGMRNSSARVVAERSLGVTGKAINQNIREQYGVASSLITKTVRAQRQSISPTDRFTQILDLVGDQHSYGAAWSASQRSKGLDDKIVEAVALSYFENPQAVKLQSPALFAQLQETVRTWDKPLSELADELFDLSTRSLDDTDILVNAAPRGAMLQVAAGDYQFATSVMAQGIIDSTIAQASNVGLAFSRDQAMKMVNAFAPPSSTSSRIVSDASKAEGRRLALLSLNTAVDHQRPLTQSYVFGKGSVLVSGAIDRPSLLKAATKIGKADDVERAATNGEAVEAMLEGVEEMYTGQVYIPDAIKQELDRATQQLITASRPGDQAAMASTYKQFMVYGMFAPNPRFYVNQVTQESDNIGMAIGTAKAVKSGIHAILPTMMVTPLVPLTTGFVDVVRGTRGGATATATMNTVSDLISIAPFGYPTSKAMGAADEVIDGMMGVTYADLNRIGVGRGVNNAPQVTDLNRSLEEAFREPLARLFREPSVRGAMRAAKDAAATATLDVTKELGTAITERRRWGTMMMLFEESVEQLRAGGGALTKERILAVADDAAKAATEIHMDYNATMHPVEKDFLESYFIPFYSFEKSNMIRIARQLGTRGERYLGGIGAARVAYRAGRWTRSKRELVEAASFYFDPSDMYGFDAEAMEDDDEATAESMRKDGKTEEEIQAAMLLPQYKAIIAMAEATGVEPWQARHNISWDSDPRLSMFTPFMDYYNAPVPGSIVPDKYSEIKSVFPIIRADSRIRSARAYGDMMNPKTSMGPNASYTMWTLPEDSNLAALSRPIALLGVLSSFAALRTEDPTAPQRLQASLFKLTGDPFGFNPLGSALGNALLASEGTSKTTTQPVKLDDATGELLMKILPSGSVTKTNERIKWTMLNEDGGTVEVDAEPGYYMSPQSAPMLGMALTSFLDGTSQVERVADLITGLKMSMDENTADEGLRRITKAVGSTGKKLDINKLERSDAQQARGNLARMPNVSPSAYTEVAQTLEGASLELYQRGQQRLAGEDGAKAAATTLRNFAGLSSEMMVGTPDTARVLLSNLGVLTEQEAGSLPNEDILKAAEDPRVRAAARDQGRMDIEAMQDDRMKASAVKTSMRAVAGGYGKAPDYAIVRYVLVAGGNDEATVDGMSGEDIRSLLARSAEQ